MCDQFTCALQRRGLLLQGQLLIFERYVGFHSRLFGVSTVKVIPLQVRWRGLTRSLHSQHFPACSDLKQCLITALAAVSKQVKHQLLSNSSGLDKPAKCCVGLDAGTEQPAPLSGGALTWGRQRCQCGSRPTWASTTAWRSAGALPTARTRRCAQSYCCSPLPCSRSVSPRKLHSHWSFFGTTDAATPATLQAFLTSFLSRNEALRLIVFNWQQCRCAAPALCWQLG